MGLCVVVAAAVGLCGPALAAVPESPATQQTVAAENSGGSQVLHILIGHSVVIRTEARLKRVLVGNPAVLTTTTTAPNEVVIIATAAGSSSVVLWQENDQSRILEVFADLDVAMLREAVARSFPGERVGVEAEEGRVLLSGTASTQAVADQIVKMTAPFSKEVVNSVQIALPSRQKQILLKVKFAQVDRRKLTAFGINLLSTGAANTVGSTTTQQFGTLGLGDSGKLSGAIGAPVKGFSTTATISDLLNIFIFRPDLNLGATIKDLQQRNVLEILAEPNLLAANGEKAEFLAGGELPYPVVSGVAGQSTVTVQFKPFGVKLEFTGTIESDNTIRLKVNPEVSSLDFSNSVTISGFVLPAIATRNAHTVVELRDGQSFAIAGLLDQRTTVQLSKVPGIGDIPILGLLFRSRSVDKLNSELVVIVTPTIVDPAGAPSAAPELPKMPIAPLDNKRFDNDKEIPSNKGSS